MKKLMFATALVASVAAFADPLNAISFEGYEAGCGPVTNAEEIADGDFSPTTAGYTYFYFTNTSGGANSSYVTNYENGTTFAEGHRPKWYADQSASDAPIGKYLALDTEGGTLWRNINKDTDNFVARPVASTGTYLDTLVQFTVTEDDAPEIGAEDKLAIWLQATTNSLNEAVTNLMVRAGYLDDNGSDSFVTATDFILSTAEPIEAGRWYRLTVKAIGDVTACVAKNSENYDSGYMGFEIYLDGVQLVATTATISTDYLDVAKGSDEFAWLDETNDAAFLAYLGSGKVFPSLEGKVAAYAIQGVGFQGTGAVDEIVWTEEDPISGSGSSIDFTLTWGDGVTAVSYTIGVESPVDISSETSPYTITVDPDTVVTVAATAADWYVISSGTGAVTVATAGTTNEIVAAYADSPEAAGAGDKFPAGVTTAQVRTWATSGGRNLSPDDIAACTYAYESYLLNTGLLDAAPALTIESIEKVAADETAGTPAGWKITIKAAVGETGISLDGINGTLKVKATSDLSTIDSASQATYPVPTFDANGVATIIVTAGGNFMKATVE